jgi:hypothetical protein
VATNITGLKPLRLFSVGLFEGHGASEKFASTGGRQNEQVQ